MPIMNPPPSDDGIFISYVHEDHAVAVALTELLRSQGLSNIFFTGNEWLLRAGEIWLDRIRTELISAKIVLSLFSPHSMGRPWLHFEAGAAWLTNRVLIPVCIGGLKREELQIPYAGIQGITLIDSSSAYYLIHSICSYTPLKTGFPTPPPFSWDHPAWLKLESALKANGEPA
jgi:hypothetical protein